jgi:hypothetical protein
LFLGNTNKFFQDLLNQSLNIQWALDIKAKFSKYEVKHHILNNLEEWLNEIADEDDRG